MNVILALSLWQHWFKQFTPISCFVSLSNIFSLVYNLTMNHLKNEQRLQIIEFYYQNAYSIQNRIFHFFRAQLLFYCLLTTVSGRSSLYRVFAYAMSL